MTDAKDAKIAELTALVTKWRDRALKAESAPRVMKLEDTFDMDQLRERYGVARNTLYLWMKNRGFPQPASSHGMKKLWSRVEVAAWDEKENSDD